MGKTAWSRRKKGKAGAVSLSPIPMLPGRRAGERGRHARGHAARARASLVERPDVLLFPIHLRSPTELGSAAAGGHGELGYSVGFPRVCNGSLDLGPGRSRLVSKQWITIFYSPCAKVKGN